jgi:hypothetical protein
MVYKAFAGSTHIKPAKHPPFGGGRIAKNVSFRSDIWINFLGHDDLVRFGKDARR